MKRYLILGIVIVLVGLPLTLLSLREFQDDPTLPLDALNRSVSGVLRKLPGVDHVEVHRILFPTHRIIHLRDRHFVSRELFAIELRDSSSKALSRRRNRPSISGSSLKKWIQSSLNKWNCCES